jgi:hypothetical protein
MKKKFAPRSCRSLRKIESTGCTPGASFLVRIGEGTAAVEDVTCTANTTVTNTLTVSSLTKDHLLGDRVSLVDITGSQTIG